jgi:hypothetical protein
MSMDEQILPTQSYAEIVDNPYVAEYIELAFQSVAIVSKTIDLARQLSHERETRLKIQAYADEQREIITRRMNQLDIELEADIENAKNVINVSLRAFEKLVDQGQIEAAMILHERIINKLSSRVSDAADKFNQKNTDGQVKFYTT